MGTRIFRLGRDNWLILLILCSVLAAFLALRTRPSNVGSVSEVDAILENGQPTLVEFYSNT